MTAAIFGPGAPAPDIDRLAIGFIGAGRLGSALARVFADRGMRVTRIASGSTISATALAGRIDGCAAASAQEVANQCDLIFAAVPDAAIAPLAEELSWRAGAALVHCSGATEVSALGKAAADGTAIGGFHPLQAFGDPEAAMRTLPGCTVTIEADGPLDAALRAIAGRIGCPVNRLPPGMRGRYHAAAGYGSQFINVLMHEAAHIWRSWGGTEEEAVRALTPMIAGTLASIARMGPAGAMPGPVSRGDADSVEKHVASLGEMDREIPGERALDLYAALCGRTLDMALAQGALDEGAAGRIRKALKS